MDVVKDAIANLRNHYRVIGYSEGLIDGAKLAQKWSGDNLAPALEVAAEDYEEKHSVKEAGK